MYLIINKDHTLQKSKILTGEIRSLARKGKISLVNCKLMIGMNRPDHAEIHGGEWSDINNFYNLPVVDEGLE